jgi:hypothetical protein
MDDLLKDAIADAKAVRETAIANAKLALEEAFTPKLQNMLSQKIQNEIEIDEEEDEIDEERDEKEEGKMRRDGDEMEEERDDEVEEERDDEVEEGEHEGGHDDEVEEGEHGDEDEVDESDELDLEAIIKELEAEINEEEDDEVEEGEERDDKKDEVKEEDEDDEDKDDIEENDVSSGIGKSDNAHDKKSGDSSGIGSAGKAKHESVDEEFDLDSILEALKDEEVTEGEEVEEEVDEVAELRAELDETREAVKFMRDKLNEVNLLNAKLLFTNKLFRAYGLNNEQKMKVVETFDRASNIREVKLVYSTMAETFGGAKKNEIQESKGSASKAVASTKSEKQSEVISEGNALRDRFKKLANII